MNNYWENKWYANLSKKDLKNDDFIGILNDEFNNISKTEMEIALRNFDSGWTINSIIDNLLFENFCPDDLF